MNYILYISADGLTALEPDRYGLGRHPEIRRTRALPTPKPTKEVTFELCASRTTYRTYEIAGEYSGSMNLDEEREHVFRLHRLSVEMIHFYMLVTRMMSYRDTIFVYREKVS